MYRLPRIDYGFTVLSEIGFPEDGLPSMDNRFLRMDFLKRDYRAWIMIPEDGFPKEGLPSTDNGFKKTDTR